MREWIAITEINAPSGQEQPRAKYIETLLRKYHLDDIHYDSAGNLIAVRRGAGGGPVIVFDAHMDTVFQPGLQIKYQLRVPAVPSSNLNIGMLGGSEVVNAKASDAWFTVDLRSTSNEVIGDLEKRIRNILNEEAVRVGMQVKTDVISASPAAVIPGHRESYLVRMAEAVHRVMGFDPPITNAGSNNSSAALHAGISSISTGAGPCDGAHSLAENCEIEPLYKGIKKVLLLEVALAGVE